MLLKQEVPYASVGPIGAEASTSFQVEDLHTLTNSFDDALFGCLEGRFMVAPCHWFSIWNAFNYSKRFTHASTCFSIGGPSMHGNAR